MAKLPVIIDNRSNNSVLKALQRILPNLKHMDLATGVFEIGSLLILEPHWQSWEKIRILFGDEATNK